ncbi:type I-F CRISPR-associated endoribonuclease Cas6/Csy4, partial [Sansalvadorimonas verongulae]|uniref:type I-F CRISPR-associated endoribonuclease Cas6/Csy4 n=1 Tax=Sansalvadorimonas verongulae TaxID=2172824 RepID=UPI0012BC4D72
MMDSYFEIKALPNAEIIQSAVVSELLQELHRHLPAYEGRIALAFPAYGQQRTLGGILRLLGDEEDIKGFHTLLLKSSLIQDYALQTVVKTVPDNVDKFGCYQRKHARGNSRLQRLKRRHQERGTWTEELEQAMFDKVSQPVHLPHLGLKSSSTGQQFLLFVEKKSGNKCVKGAFNAYGLSVN